MSSKGCSVVINLQVLVAKRHLKGLRQLEGISNERNATTSSLCWSCEFIRRKRKFQEEEEKADGQL
jgi:hypothetical protein